MPFEVSSLNAGLKTYILQQDNPAYSAREEILKDLFRRYGVNAGRKGPLAAAPKGPFLVI